MFEDQSVFLLAAERIKECAFPFLHFFDLIQKPPGILLPALLAVLISQDPVTQSLIASFQTLACHCLNSVLLWALVKSTYGNSRVAVLGASIFWLSFIGLTTSESLLAEPYFLTCALTTMLLLVRKKNPWFSGLSLMLSFLFRPTAVLLFLAALIFSRGKGKFFLIRLMLPSLLIIFTTAVAAYSLGITHVLIHSFVSFNSFHPQDSSPVVSRILSFARYFFAEIFLGVLILLWQKSRDKLQHVESTSANQLRISAIFFGIVETTFLLLNRSFFDHYLYEILPLIAVSLAIPLASLSTRKQAIAMAIYATFSLLLVADRIELGGEKLTRCTGVNLIPTLITDIPLVVLARGNRQEWYWQQSQESAYQQSGLAIDFGERDSFASKVKQSSPNAILLLNSPSPEFAGYERLDYRLQRPTRNGLQYFLPVADPSRTVSIFVNPAFKKDISTCLVEDSTNH